MDLEKMRARVEAIRAKIEEYLGLESLTDEDAKVISDLNEEFDSLKAKIEAVEKLQAMAAKTSTSTGRKVEAKSEIKAEVGIDRRTRDPKAGFKHSGEFFKAVYNAAGGSVDKRLTIQGGLQEKIGEDGGFLIPPDFRQELINKVQGDESLLPKTRQFQTSSNTIIMPSKETAPWDSSSGVIAYWQGEAAAYTASQPVYGELQMRLHKLTALVRATDEVLEDAVLLDSYIRQEAPEVMLHKVNSAIIDGSGSGQPLGLLSSGFKYEVAKESGQTADTIVFENVNKMQARLLPMSRRNAVWLCNPEVLVQLPLMKFDSGATSPVPVYLPANGVAGAPFGSLYGLPLMPMMGGTKALGDAGDLILADLSYYYTAIKSSGVKSDISTHVYFSTDEVAFKFSMRMAGQVPFKAPVTTENGSYQMSAIVTLADRA